MNFGSFIGKLEKMRERLDNVPEVVEWFVHDNKEMLVDLNRDQMLLGRNAEGEILTPGYLEDPYFKTPEAAQRYAARKAILERRHHERITYPLNFPEKDRNTPNLIIRGDFQDAMFIKPTPDSFTIDSSYKYAGDIDTKYRKKLYGLAPLSRQYVWDNGLRYKIMNYLFSWL